jgi:hypothetical protein
VDGEGVPVFARSDQLMILNRLARFRRGAVAVFALIQRAQHADPGEHRITVMVCN